jgi:putative ABC transport system permease protein
MSLLKRLRTLFKREQFENNLDEELKFHVEMKTRENLAAGMPPEEARSAALRQFGNVTRAKEETRPAWNLPRLETFVQDFRYGLRQLRRSPGFSLLAILCLAVGIGSSTAVMSWIEGILFRPFPLVAHQDRMMAMIGTERGVPGFSDISWPDFKDLRTSCTLAESFIAEKITGARVSIGDRGETIPGSIVSSNYFDALGVHPILGRGFEPQEETGRNAHPVTVISYQFWQERLGGDPNVIGKTKLLDKLPYTIVGVAPRGFFGTFVGYSFQFWVPVSMQEVSETDSYKLEDRSARWIEGFVMLKPDVTREQAQQEITAAAARLEHDYPTVNRGRGVTILPLWQTPFNAARVMLPTLGVALVVAVFVLLIVCANVGNLLLVRSVARRHEMTVRLAIGAGRVRLVRQLLTEGLILAILAAGGGLVLAHWLRNALVYLVPSRGTPILLQGELDWRVLVLSGGVCVLSTLLFGLGPALQASGINVSSVLNSESAGVIGGRGRAWIRSGLVLVQVSLSFLLLVGAGLVIRSLRSIRASNPGFSTRDVLMTAVFLPSSAYDMQKAKDFQDESLIRVRSLAGVESATYARIAPFSLREYSNAPIAVEGDQSNRIEKPTADYDEIGSDYFTTMGIPLVEGREFTRADDETAPLVAVVNETMAKQYWHGQSPIGKRLQVKDRWMRVVGVAKNSKYRSFLEPPAPFFYVPLRQNPSMGVMLLIRTKQSPVALAASLAHELRTLDPDLDLYEVITLHTQVNRSASSQRVAVALLSVFAGLALPLAAIGFYGVMSFAVSQSRRDLGLRIALGAEAADVLRHVMAPGLALTAAGLALGACVALASTRLLGYLLYNVSPRDPLTFASALAVMTAASLAACLVPAWRATKVDPVVALRCE